MCAELFFGVLFWFDDGGRRTAKNLKGQFCVDCGVEVRESKGRHEVRQLTLAVLKDPGTAEFGHRAVNC